MDNIYLDYAAATPLAPEVLKAMQPYFDVDFANAESRHSAGQKTRIAIDQARSTIGGILNCRPDEIIFCSSGTEANNLAIKGFARANRERGNHLVVSKIEHSSVLEAAKYLEKYENFEVTYLPVDSEGLVDPKVLAANIKDTTILISIIYANNEIGTIQQIDELAGIAHDHSITFHTDACQAAGKLPLDCSADMMTISASKIYGPKGGSCLFRKQNIKLHPLLHGGEQEFGLRSSTPNTAAIVGLATALEIADKNRDNYNKEVGEIRDQLLNQLVESLDIQINGPQPGPMRLSNNLNLQFKGIDNHALLLHLDEAGLACSTGSACSNKRQESSHVLKAIGLSEAQSAKSIRISLGTHLSHSEIQSASQIIIKIAQKLAKQ